MKSVTAAVVVLVLVVVLAAWLQLKRSPESVQDHYLTQEQCELQAGKSCSFVMCDYVPEGSTPDEVCGQGFTKGWVPTSVTESQVQPADGTCVALYVVETMYNPNNPPPPSDPNEIDLNKACYDLNTRAACESFDVFTGADGSWAPDGEADCEWRSSVTR